MVLRQVTTESEGDKQDFDFPTTATQGLIVDADERVDGEQQHLHVSYDHKIGAWAHRCINPVAKQHRLSGQWQRY